MKTEKHKERGKEKRKRKKREAKNTEVVREGVGNQESVKNN